MEQRWLPNAGLRLWLRVSRFETTRERRCVWGRPSVDTAARAAIGQLGSAFPIARTQMRAAGNMSRCNMLMPPLKTSLASQLHSYFTVAANHAKTPPWSAADSISCKGSEWRRHRPCGHVPGRQPGVAVQLPICGCESPYATAFGPCRPATILRASVMSMCRRLLPCESKIRLQSCQASSNKYSTLL